MRIFAVKDKSSKIVYLSKERWQHITKEHNVAVEELQQTIMLPLVVKRSKYDDKVRWYYKFNKKRKNYSFVSVKYLNGEGYVITAYFVKKIK